MENTAIYTTAQKFLIKDFFRKCDQIHRFLRIWSHLLKKSLMENFIFCVVYREYESGYRRFYLMSSVARYVIMASISF